MEEGPQENNVDADLVDRLERAARRGPTRAEIAAQRVSYAYSMVDDQSGVTREQVQQWICPADCVTGLYVR